MSTHRPRGHATLAADLRRRDDAALAALLRARPDLLSPVPADLTSLAARATSKPSVLRALDGLNRFQLQVLEACCVLDEPAEAAALPEAVGAPADEALALLWAQALVFHDLDGRLYVPVSVREAVGAPAGLGPRLEVLLTAYGPWRLEQLAGDLGGPPRAVLTDGARLGRLLDQAPVEARRALDALTWGPPSGTVDNARRQVTKDTADSPMDWLLAHGLVIATDDRTVVLPQEVALHLRGGRVHRQAEPAQPDPVTTPIERARVDRAAAGAAAEVVRRVEDLLELWAAAPPRVLRAGGVGVRDRARTVTALDLDEATVTLLLETAYAAGLLAPGDDPHEGLDEVWLPTPAYDQWLEEPTAQRWLALVTCWLDSPRVVGLAGATDAKGRALVPLGPGLERGIAPAVRQAVLRDLADLPPDVQTEADSLTARLRWRSPRRAGRLHDDLVRWTLVEAATLGLAVGGALASYGRRLATGDVDGAYDGLDALVPAPLDHVLLQADLTAIAPGPLQPHLTRQLRLIADVESTGGATVYRFTPGSIRRGFDAGWSATEVLSLLRTHSRTPVPQPLTYLVEDVARRHGQVRVGAASAYIRCDDEATVEALTADRRAAALRLRRLAGTVLAAQSEPDVVLRTLREMGYAPAAESGDGDVVVRRPTAPRAAARPAARPAAVAPPAPTDLLLAAAVQAVRAGERSDRPSVSRPVADVLAMLSDAAATATPLWIGYVDAEGRSTQRMIQPLRVEGGLVRAYDHLRDAERSFAIHRITGISPVRPDLEETGA